MLELTRTIFDGTGETALGVPKELTLNEFARYGGAVDLYHWGFGAGAILVDEMCYYLFARAVGTCDEYACFGGSYLVNGSAHASDGGALANHLVAFADFLTQDFGLFDQ